MSSSSPSSSVLSLSEGASSLFAETTASRLDRSAQRLNAPTGIGGVAQSAPPISAEMEAPVPSDNSHVNGSNLEREDFPVVEPDEPEEIGLEDQRTEEHEDRALALNWNVNMLRGGDWESK